MTTQDQYRALLAEQPVFAAPMCGISDYAHRAMCRSMGGGFAFTQMAAAEGVSRVEADATSATAVDLGDVPPRSLDFVTATDVVLTGVAYSCDRSDVTLLVRERFWAPGATAPLPTGLLAPRPGACGRARFDARPGIAPIGPAGPKLVALVGGSIIGDPAAATSPPGSARSPDGRFIVTPTPFGLLLSGSESLLLNLPPDAGSPLELGDCVPANDGRTVACVAKGRVLVARGS